MLRVLSSALPLLLLISGPCAPWQITAHAEQPVNYVAIGASDTVGEGAQDPRREGWVPRFYQQLPQGSRLINLGVSGSLLGQAINQQLPVALAAKPDVVTVWLAVNDLNAGVPLRRYAADLDRLLGALRQTNSRVLVANVPDVSQLPVYRLFEPEMVRAEINAWNAVIADAATRHGTVLVDLHSSWRELAEHPEYVAADGFHPSSEGYSRLAELFWQAFESSGVPRQIPRA